MRLNNRFLFGLLSLLLAAIIAFIALPTIARQTNGKTEIVRVSAPILKGAVITDKSVELAEVGSYNLPANLARSTEDVTGRYAVTDLMEGDYILSSKISALPLTSDIALNDIPSGRVAISLSIKTLASGLSDKLQAGDIVRIYHFLETAREIPELRFVRVLSVTSADGINIDNTKEPTEDEEKQQSATVTNRPVSSQSWKMTELPMLPLSPAIMRSWRRNCLQSRISCFQTSVHRRRRKQRWKTAKEHTYGKNNYRMGQPRQRKIYVLLYARQGPDKR